MQEFEKAKKKGVAGLCHRSIWREVKRSDLKPDATEMGDRFVDSLKRYGLPSERARVRCVAQGFSDEDEPFMVHDATSLHA